MSPQAQPSLVFDGNTAHSSGYWWGQAACMYTGGQLMYNTTAPTQLTYNPGRIVSGRAILNGGFQQFTNTKVFLCNVGILHWGQASEIKRFEVGVWLQTCSLRLVLAVFVTFA
jgi:hypothetical protein